MRNKLVKILLLLLTACSTFTQDISSINQEIRKIDSLIVYNQFEQVEQKVDSLFLSIKNSNYQEQILKVRLQKAMAIDFKNEHGEALLLYLDVSSKAERYEFNKIACQSKICISLIHEKNDDLVLAYTYIKSALDQCQKFDLDELYSTIMIRLASIHRIIIRYKIASDQTQKLEKLGFKANLDSAMKFARQAIPFAQKYHKYKDLKDAYFLLGACYSYQKKDKIAIEYFLKTIPYDKKLGKAEDISLNYNNIARKYLDLKDGVNALKYNDSAYRYYPKIPFDIKFITPQQRSDIFHALNQPDSAYHYLQMAFNDKQVSNEKQKNIDTKKIEEKFQNEKNKEIIKTKNQQMIFILCLLGVIAVAAILFVRKNRQINTQNKIINQQVIDLKKNLEQKQILLSELQHRVKNNLQYVISILEIQKESVSFSNIEELIRSNQNRIHSISLLHKKLNLTDSVNEVDLKRYVAELADVVKDSYEIKEKNISLFITCEIEILAISKALPLGLIIVELVSNSMKHAFKNRPNGIINIEITYNEELKKSCLDYIDNGEGFDFNKSDLKGLGLEIMKGLIDQLNGKIVTQTKNGFELKMYF
jgi:two-component sensor histidine kinase